MSVTGWWDGVWVHKPRWTVSHKVKAGSGTSFPGYGETARAVCGATVAVDSALEPEPTGIDTIERCFRCVKRTGDEP